MLPSLRGWEVLGGPGRRSRRRIRRENSKIANRRAGEYGRSSGSTKGSL